MDASRDYDLFVRQQPKQARMCGVGADRRPIDPPPIVQLRVIDKPTHPPHAHNPYFFMFASLAKPDDDTELHWMKDGKTRCTTGSVVSSLYHLKDAENDNRDAGFFVFPDLSVRQEGSYRLKLSLFEVVGSNVYHCKSIFSSPFYVYTAKKFPGMEESTALSCSLADQGIKIRIRKDIRQRKPRSGITNFPITSGQPLGPGIPIPDEESDRESEVRHDDHSDTTNNHNTLATITSKPSNSRKRSEREVDKDREREVKRPRVDGEEGEPAPNPPPSTGEWGIDPALAPGGSSSSSYEHPHSTTSAPPPPPPAPGYPIPPPAQHHAYEQPPPPPQHPAPQPAHHPAHPPQHQPPHHYTAPPPQSVHPAHHPAHPPPPPPYHTQYASSWPPQHPQHPPPPPHQYDHYQQHYSHQYPPPPRYASSPYEPYPPPPQQQSVPAYAPGAGGYYAQYSRPGDAYSQYAPPPPPPPGPEGPNSAGSRNPPAYGQYQPHPPQQPPHQLLRPVLRTTATHRHTRLQQHLVVLTGVQAQVPLLLHPPGTWTKRCERVLPEPYSICTAWIWDAAAASAECIPASAVSPTTPSTAARAPYVASRTLPTIPSTATTPAAPGPVGHAKLSPRAGTSARCVLWTKPEPERRMGE
ncbi:velvet factor-domain-containing protein [Lactifluus subvellereus]|nr:velvet factor-domain-containing protein [Lactifluus subvellereus]